MRIDIKDPNGPTKFSNKFSRNVIRVTIWLNIITMNHSSSFPMDVGARIYFLATRVYLPFVASVSQPIRRVEKKIVEKFLQ